MLNNNRFGKCKSSLPTPMELAPEDSSTSIEIDSPESSEDESDESVREFLGEVRSRGNRRGMRGGGSRRGRGRGVRGGGSRRGRGRGVRGQKYVRGRGRNMRGIGNIRGRNRGVRGRGRGRGVRRIGNRRRNRQPHEVLDGPWIKEESNALTFPFTGSDPGPSVPVDNSVSVSDLFCRFFTDEVWDLITVETNRYAFQQQQRSLHVSPRAWHDVSVPEMKSFIGIMILMGICRLPRLRLYWTTKYPYISPEINKIMSLTRFEQIYRFLHLCNSEKEIPAGNPGHDYLFKVRSLLDLLAPRFFSEYNTHEELSVDEAMIPFKGRLGIKQYMKDKPTKWGIKVFVLADARNGYTIRHQVYCGKNSSLSNAEPGLSTRVVLELLDGLESTSPKIYMDNYYTSPELFLASYKKNVNACGTARSTRKYYPEDLAVSKTVETGYYDYRSCGPILACVWKDKRIIHFLSTMHVAEASSTITVERRDKDGSKRNVQCPPLLPDYQKFMRS